MKISIQTLGTLGDVMPFLTVAKALQARGHSVSVLAPRDHSETIQAWGVDVAEPPGFSVADWMQEAEARGTLSGPFSFFRDWHEMIEPHALDVLDRSIDAAGQAELVLANPIAMPARIAAEHCRNPLVLIALQPVITPSSALPCAMIARQGLSGPGNKASYIAVAGALAGLASVLGRERQRLVPEPRPAFWRLDRHLGRPLPRITALPAIFGIKRPDDFTASDHLVDYPPLQSSNGLDPALEAFLKAGPAPLHVSLGSMPTREVAHALPVWLERIERSGHRAILSTSLAGRPAGGMGVHFVSGPAPHDRLFPHCSAVIHHGGAGTLDTAARAGVPQIILPQVLDQFWNARQLADTGAGIILRKKDHTAENIDAALQTILSDSVQDTARQAAERLKARASTAELVSLIEAYGVAR